MTHLDQLRCMKRAIELCDGDHFTEAEALRLAYLEHRERQEPPSPQLPLLTESVPSTTTSAI